MVLEGGVEGHSAFKDSRQCISLGFSAEKEKGDLGGAQQEAVIKFPSLE
jgi:hypothetical protein